MRWIAAGEDDMNENDDGQESSISKAGTTEEIAEFWDNHSLADHWDQTKEVEFDVRPSVPEGKEL